VDENYFVECVSLLTSIVGKKRVIFMDKCRDAAELIMRYSKNKGFKNLILQEEGGWYTYEKSGDKVGLKVIKAPMNKGVLIKEEFPFLEDSLIIINTNPGYAYSDPLSFYDDFKNINALVVNDVVCSIGDVNSLKGDFIIGSFGKHKPLSINSGGAFIACDDDSVFKELLFLKNSFYSGSGEKIDFKELLWALKNFDVKKKKWVEYSSSLKKILIAKNFDVLNPAESINIFVGFSSDLEKENLIKFCAEHELEYLNCPLYIRTLKKAISIEIKKKSLEE